MAFQGVKGTRDFYPDVMRLRNWITDAWRRVSLRNGFEEYDSPIFEYLDLFTAKSGQEIVEQLFSLTDRGGRNLAIRPEITPALARMVNARINALPRPIKWFSVPRLCRAENPQKGRLREFFQWNIDIIGSDDVLADAECIYVAVDFLREVGLTPGEVVVEIGSRALITAILKSLGLDEATADRMLPVLDRRRKVAPEEFKRQVLAAGLGEDQFNRLGEYLSVPAEQRVQNLSALAGKGEDFAAATAELLRLWEHLGAFGITDYCRLNLSIVRGLAYYTGVVYEVFDTGQNLRAIAGGGRYDNLLAVLGGPQVGATGFGMGDVVLGILLAERGKLPQTLKSASLDMFVIEDRPELADLVLQTVGALRRAGLSADFSYKRQNVGKQLKDANKRGARKAVIVKSADLVAVKDLATGEQVEMPMTEFLAKYAPRVPNP